MCDGHLALQRTVIQGCRPERRKSIISDAASTAIHGRREGVYRLERRAVNRSVPCQSCASSVAQEFAAKAGDTQRVVEREYGEQRRLAGQHVQRTLRDRQRRTDHSELITPASNVREEDTRDHWLAVLAQPCPFGESILKANGFHRASHSRGYDALHGEDMQS